MKHLITLLSILLIGTSCASNTKEKKWTNLLDPKLASFVKHGGKAVYEIKDGVLIGKTRPRTANTFLCTKKNYSDFELEYEFKVDPKLNSGVQIRSNLRKQKNGSLRVWGYQCEIDASKRAWTAGIMEEAGRGWLNNLKKNPAARKAFKQNQWNKVRIVAQGDSIKTWLNGVPAADLKDNKTASGFIGFQVHNVPYKEERLVMWKNIRIHEFSIKKQ